MKTKINKLSIVNKIALLSIIVLLITNPWSVGYIDYALELFATYFVMYSIYFFVAALLCTVGIVVYFMYSTRDKINVPQVESLRDPEVR